MPNPTLSQLKALKEQIFYLYPPDATYDDNAVGGILFAALTTQLSDAQQLINLTTTGATAGIVQHASGNVNGYHAMFGCMLEKYPHLAKCMFNVLIGVLHKHIPIDKRMLELFKGHLFAHDVAHDSELRKKIINNTNSSSPEELMTMIRNHIQNDIKNLFGSEEVQDESDKFDY